VITVVLPVHNGGRYLRECIEGLARQDAPPGSFDLVVLDNQSTDGSLDALHLLPDHVPRKVHPSDRLLPIEENWARIRDLPDLRSFMTVTGHDDVFDAHFIRVTSEALRRAPDTSLLLTHFRLIDQDSRHIRPCRPMHATESPAEFLAARFAGIRDSYGTGYVFASSKYREAGGIPPLPRLIWADDVLWMTLARGSYTRILEDQCFSYRLHSSSTQHVRDQDVIVRALSGYLSFVEAEAAADPSIARVLRVYGPTSVRQTASVFLLEEANRGNQADEPARSEVLDAWHAVVRRADAFAEFSPEEPDSRELAFSLWANSSSMGRRLWRNRPARRLLKAAFVRGLISNDQRQ
jgi:hypothetical protein